TNLTSVSEFKFGIPSEAKDRGAAGPGAARVDLLADLGGDVDVARDEIIRTSWEVYQDKNANSGIFYFLPHSYQLDWDRDSGYGLHILYGASTAEGQAGQVVISMRLKSHVETAEIQLARTLLDAYSARHGTLVTELRPLPIEKQPEVTF